MLNGSDGELVQAWKAADSRAGEALFERYYNAVARFFFNKTDEASAQDLIQKTFLTCIESLHRLQSLESFRGFLFTIAYRVLCKHYEGRARERGQVDISELSVQDLALRSPTQMFAEREEQKLLLRALRSIPLESQVVLELVYWEKMTAIEVAAVMAIPEGTAKSRVRRGRQLLEEAMAKLSASEELRRSTLDNIERWADEVRRHGRLENR